MLRHSERQLSILPYRRAVWAGGVSRGSGGAACGLGAALSKGAGGLRHLWRAVMERSRQEARARRRAAGRPLPASAPRVLIAARASRRPRTWMVPGEQLTCSSALVVVTSSRYRRVALHVDTPHNHITIWWCYTKITAAHISDRFIIWSRFFILINRWICKLLFGYHEVHYTYNSIYNSV